jgi:hypothetical protein
MSVENLRKLLGAAASLADFEQCPGDRAHHVLQEAVAADPEYPRRVRPVPACIKNRSRTLVDFTCCCTKRREIVRAQEIPRREVDRFFVKRVTKCVHISRVERAYDRASPYMVLVCFRSRGSARMKVRADFLHGENSNISWEKRIDSAQHRVRVHSPDRFDAGNLPVRVYARVGPSRTFDLHLMIQELLKSLSQLALNGTQFRLVLPAVELRTVVGESQLEVPHSIGYSMCLGVRAMPGITGTIITFNEEPRIAEAVASLACCDEVIVVDSGSSDRTRDIARDRGARVIEQPWEGYARQKNFAAEQAAHDWILSIDADERLSIELAGELTQWKKSYDIHPQSLERAWAMPRRVFYLGKWIGHSGWYPDRKIRLYDRRFCRWEGDFVHERMSAPGVVGNFSGDLLHFPFHDWNDHRARIARYTELAAQAARAKGKRGSVAKLVLAPPLTFVRGFILQAGFLDGWRGLAIAYMGARYVFRREFRILR